VLVGHSASSPPARTGENITPHEEYQRIPLKGKRPGSRAGRQENGTKAAPARGKGRPGSNKRR